jgi:hypothetical protein
MNEFERWEILTYVNLSLLKIALFVDWLLIMIQIGRVMLFCKLKQEPEIFSIQGNFLMPGILSKVKFRTTFRQNTPEN